MKKLNKKIQVTLSVLTLLAMTLLLASCGGSSDPMKEYKLNGKLADKKQVATEQNFCTQPFQISVLSDKGGNVGLFTEGRSSSIRVQVTTINPNIVASPLLIKNFPYSNSQPQVSNNGSGLYTITWLPPVGTTSPKSIGESKTFDVSVSALSGPCAVTQSQTIPIVVGKSLLTPSIVSIDFNGRDKNAKEGDVIPFTVTIHDPNYTSGAQLPELDSVPVHYTKVEAYNGDAAGLIVSDFINKPKELGHGDREIPSNIERSSNNNFIFHKALDLTKIPLNRDIHGNVDPDKNFIDLCFGIRAISSNQTDAGIPITKCVFVHFVAQAPSITWTNQENSLVAGQQKNIEFKISVPMAPSKLELNAEQMSKSLSSQIKNLSGKPSVSCKEDLSSKDSQICNLDWTPSCNSKNKTIAVQFKVKSVLGDNTKTTNVSKYFEIGDADASCAQPSHKAEKKK